MAGDTAVAPAGPAVVGGGGSPGPTGAPAAPKATPKPSARATPAPARPAAPAKPPAGAIEAIPAGADAGLETEAPEPEASPEEKVEQAKEEARRYKLHRRNGETLEEVEYEEDALLRMAQRGQDYEPLIQDAREILELAKKDPAAFLQQLEVNPDEFAEQLLAKRAEEHLLTDEQKAERARTKELEDLRTERDALQKEKQERIQAEYETKAMEEIDTGLFEAVKRAGLEDADRHAVTAEAAKIAIAAIENDVNLTHDQVVAEAKSNIERAKEHLVKRIAKGLTGQKLLKVLGPDICKAAVAAELEQYRQKLHGPPPQEEETKPAPKPSSESKTYLTPEEFEARKRPWQR